MQLLQIQVRDKHSSVKFVTIRASSASNSNFFYKTEGLRVKDGGLRVKDGGSRTGVKNGGEG